MGFYFCGDAFSLLLKCWTKLKYIFLLFSTLEMFVVDDFRKLIRASDASVLWQGAEGDKGHVAELGLLADAIATGSPAPIAFDEIVETSAVALQIEDLIYGRESDRP